MKVIQKKIGKIIGISICLLFLLIIIWASVIYPTGVKKGWIVVDKKGNTRWNFSNKENKENKEKTKLEEQKKAQEEKKREEALNKPSKFQGITVGQQQKLEGIFKNEADKKLPSKGKEYKDYKMSKTDNNYVIYGTKVTEDRGVDIYNLFTVGIYWDGKTENYEVHTNSYAASAKLNMNQESKLYEIAKEAVKTKLLAPQTADFPFVDRPRIEYSFDKAKDKNSIYYKVSNYVKYKNAFNVPFKSNFTVELEVNWIDGNQTIKNVVLD